MSLVVGAVKILSIPATIACVSAGRMHSEDFRVLRGEKDVGTDATLARCGR
jgi:hypothetical protein